MYRTLRVGMLIVLGGFAVGVLSGSVSALAVGGRAGVHPATQLFVVTTVGTSIGLVLAVLYVILAVLWSLTAALVSDVRQIFRVVRGGMSAGSVRPHESPVWDRDLDFER